MKPKSKKDLEKALREIMGVLKNRGKFAKHADPKHKESAHYRLGWIESLVKNAISDDEGRSE